MSTSPLESLELKASLERTQLHERASEIKDKINITRDNLDVERQARDHFPGLAIVAGAIGLIFGYSMAGRFTED
jgi:hypothetical protein